MSNSRVLLFCPDQLHTPHAETDMELALLHHRAGDQVFYATCESVLPACAWNPTHLPSICVRCVGKGRVAGTLLPPGITRLTVPRPGGATHEDLRSIPEHFPDNAALSSYKVEEYDVGSEALSTLISITRTQHPDLQEHKRLVGALLQAGISTYRSLQDHLRTLSIDLLYFFNGRFTPLRAALRAAQSLNVECRSHERGATLDRYLLVPNDLPHSLSLHEAWLKKAWKEAPSQEEWERVGRLFYEERLAGVTQTWISYTTLQVPGQLPAGWEPQRHNVAVFTSSDDEFASIGEEWRNPLYRDQDDGLRKMAAAVAQSGKRNMHVYVRMHPNQAAAAGNIYRQWLQLESAQFTVIPPESGVSTYDLLKACSTVVSFGSTVGIEAVYFRKPSILLGRALYQALGGVYCPKTHQAGMELAFEEGLPPLEHEAALKYGYYMKTYGEHFRYFQPSGLFGGQFLGATVAAPPAYDLVSRALGRLRGLDRRWGAFAQHQLLARARPPREQ